MYCIDSGAAAAGSFRANVQDSLLNKENLYTFAKYVRNLQLELLLAENCAKLSSQPRKFRNLPKLGSDRNFGHDQNCRNRPKFFENVCNSDNSEILVHFCAFLEWYAPYNPFCTRDTYILHTYCHSLVILQIIHLYLQLLTKY